MRFVFKTSYDADIRLHRHGAQLFWYAVLALFMLCLPLYFVWTDDAYLLGEITAVLIFSIVGMGLMMLTGQTGLASLGHAAFMAVGCYANILLLGAGVPWLIAFPLAGLIAGVIGTIVALPVLRLHGVYLALATLALSILTGDFIVLLEDFTGGVAGIAVPDISIFGLEINKFSTPYYFYYLVLAVVFICIFGYKNILRSPTGRSFAAVRDS
ncbi:MAG: branched-chain amino acid ABC transporter permease, partial [Pseudomonadota bacterium]